MHIQSAVTVNNSKFIDNQGQNLGSGVVVAYDSTLMITNSTFTNNKAYVGGGVFARKNSVLTISTSIFDGNSAFIGGPIFVDSDCFVICENSTFSNNLATQNGGAITVQKSNATMSNLTVTQNHGRGALYFIMSHFIDIYTCKFSKNTDGAIYVYQAIELAVMYSDFFQNEADHGGAIFVQQCNNFTMSHGRLVQNVVTFSGGVIASIEATLHIDNSIFETNSAYHNGVATESDNVNIAFGGVFHVIMGSLFMINCSAKHNDAVKGGVILGKQCTVNLMYCLFEKNIAYLGEGTLSITDSYFKANNVIFLNNSVSTFFGSGGAINAEQCNIYLINSLFYGNNVLKGFAGAIGIISADFLKIFNTTFCQNNADDVGVLQVYNVREIQLNSSIFVDNFSMYGGVINVTHGTFVAINSMFVRNYVAGKYTTSGCLVVSSAEVAFENCTFRKNSNNGFSYSGEGGGITSVQCGLRISTSIFDNNEASVEVKRSEFQAKCFQGERILDRLSPRRYHC